MVVVVVIPSSYPRCAVPAASTYTREAYCLGCCVYAVETTIVLDCVPATILGIRGRHCSSWWSLLPFDICRGGQDDDVVADTNQPRNMETNGPYLGQSLYGNDTGLSGTFLSHNDSIQPGSRRNGPVGSRSILARFRPDERGRYDLLSSRRAPWNHQQRDCTIYGGCY